MGRRGKNDNSGKDMGDGLTTAKDWDRVHAKDWDRVHAGRTSSLVTSLISQMEIQLSNPNISTEEREDKLTEIKVLTKKHFSRNKRGTKSNERESMGEIKKKARHEDARYPTRRQSKMGNGSMDLEDKRMDFQVTGDFQRMQIRLREEND